MKIEHKDKTGQVIRSWHFSDTEQAEKHAGQFDAIDYTLTNDAGQVEEVPASEPLGKKKSVIDHIKGFFK